MTEAERAQRIADAEARGRLARAEGRFEDALRAERDVSELYREPVDGDRETQPDTEPPTIAEIIAAMDREDASLWTRSGNPKAAAVSAIAGRRVSAAEIRDAMGG